MIDIIHHTTALDPIQTWHVHERNCSDFYVGGNPDEDCFCDYGFELRRLAHHWLGSAA